MMHVKLFGICVTYVLLFTMIMSFAGLASFPPESFAIPVNFSSLIWWLPNIQTTVTFSWSNIVTAIFTLSLTVLVVLAVISLAAQSLDMAYMTKFVLGTAISSALAVTMIATVGVLLPSWLHLFLIYIPCGLLIYSVIAIGAD